MLHLQRPGVALGLFAGILHEHVPAAPRAAPAQPFRLGGRGVHPDFLALARPAALLRLQHEAAAAVKIDAADLLAPGDIGRAHRALEDIIIGFARCAGGIGMGQVEKIGQLDQEQGIVRPLRTTFTTVPARDESFHRRGCVPVPHAATISVAALKGSDVLSEMAVCAAADAQSASIMNSVLSRYFGSIRLNSGCTSNALSSTSSSLSPARL